MPKPKRGCLLHRVGKKYGISAAERIGRKEGRKEDKKEGEKKGFLVGSIVMAQRFMKQPIYSRAELETNSLKELKGGDMKENKHRIPEEFKSPEDVRDFWDTHSSADYWDDMEDADMEL